MQYGEYGTHESVPWADHVGHTEREVGAVGGAGAAARVEFDPAAVFAVVPVLEEGAAGEGAILEL